jgi:ApaG protein
MDSLTTKGIDINIAAVYEPDSSNPQMEKYIFSYHIEIHNNSKAAVQLLDRHWIIVDADNVRREVKGPGVIGQQPVILPGGMHTYNSWSVLRTPLGKMYGSYGMIYVDTKEAFQAKIPAFKLIADFVYN